MTEYLVYMRHRVQPKVQTLRVEAESHYEAECIARCRVLGHVVTRICPLTPEVDDFALYRYFTQRYATVRCAKV